MKRVFIVEDDGALQRIYSEALKKEGFEVLIADNGTMALETMKQQPPDIILLDVMLTGGMNGFDVLEHLRLVPDLKEVPVIMLTNLDTEKNTALSMGVAEYIIKASTSVSDLIAKVKLHIT